MNRTIAVRTGKCARCRADVTIFRQQDAGIELFQILHGDEDAHDIAQYRAALRTLADAVAADEFGQDRDVDVSMADALTAAEKLLAT